MRLQPLFLLGLLAVPFVPVVHAGAPAPSWQPPPLPVCSSVALLVKYDYSYIQANKCQLCGAVSNDFCDFDWPTNDVPMCSLFDELRSGIYAYYGKPFEAQKWKDYFAKVSWYKVNPAFSESLLGPEAARNVALLKSIAQAGTACTK
jgi:hypothetical protein